MSLSTDNEKAIAQKVKEIAATADDFPGVVIIHNIQEKFNKVEYMSARGARILGVELEELRHMGADYHTRFFNEDDAKDYVPKMLEMVERNNENVIYSFFQQVRSSPSHPWSWYTSSTRILLKDASGAPLLSITFAVPIDPVHHLTNKVSRLLDENNFLRAHMKEFSSLTRREKEVMREFANGKSSSEISDVLHLAVDTIKTHRKNIYGKLRIKSGYELLEYARAFDMV